MRPFYKKTCTNLLAQMILAFLFLSFTAGAGMAAAQDEYFTIMVGSYHSLKNAEADYKALRQTLMEDWLGTLRIEKNGQYYTVRLGKFLQKSAADGILPMVRLKFKDARVLSAFYKPERIIKILSASADVSVAAQAVVTENEPSDMDDIAQAVVPEITAKTPPDPPAPVREIPGPLLKKRLYAAATIIDGDTAAAIQGGEFYTLQTGSFVRRDSAWLEFDRLRHKKNLPLAWLRIEKIKDFYTVRLGRFDDKKSAKQIWNIVQQQAPARLLRAYIKPARIIKIYAVDNGIKDATVGALNTVAEMPRPPDGEGNDISEEPPVVKPQSSAKEIRVIASRKYKVKIISHFNAPAPKKADLADHEEFYVIQAASFTNKKMARQAYNRLRKNYAADQLPVLRIEQVNGYYTVRFGKFPEQQEADEAAAVVRGKYPHLVVLQAYVLDDRIVNSEELGEAESVPEAAAKNSADDSGRTAAPVEAESSPATVTEQIDSPPTPLDVAESVAPEKNPLPVTPPKLTKKAEKTAMVTNSAKMGDIFAEESKNAKFSYDVVTVIDKDDQGEKIKMPSSLFFDRQRDELYVINGVNNRIIVYGPDFFPQNSLGKGRGIDSPMGGYIASDGRLYIPQAGVAGSGARITILNNAFMPEKEIMIAGMPEAGKFIPQRLTKTNNRLYVTGLHSKRILVLNAAGEFEKWFQVAIDKRGNYAFTNMTGSQETTYIRDVKSDFLGNLFFLSEETSKIYVFNYKENFLFSFGLKGGAEGKMSRPRGLAIDEKKHCIYVVDYMRHTVLIYDFNGKFRYEFGGRGWGAEWFNYPADIELGAQDNVIVADFFNQQVKVFATHWQESFPPRDHKLWQISDGDKP